MSLAAIIGLVVILNQAPAPVPAVYEVTAYTLAECGKAPSHPAYGITASGSEAQAGVTIAAGPEVPIGTKLHFEELEWINGTGEFIVQDRGGAIKKGKIDIYFGDPIKDKTAVARAKTFGRQYIRGEQIE